MEDFDIVYRHYSKRIKCIVVQVCQEDNNNFHAFYLSVWKQIGLPCKYVWRWLWVKSLALFLEKSCRCLSEEWEFSLHFFDCLTRPVSSCYHFHSDFFYSRSNHDIWEDSNLHVIPFTQSGTALFMLRKTQKIHINTQWYFDSYALYIEKKLNIICR